MADNKDEIRRERERFRPIPEFREPPTFPEWFGASLASRLLWVICGVVVGFLAAWYFSRPSLSEVQGLLGQSDPQTVLDALQSLQSEHFDQFSRIFQLAVLSALVPLFTLLAGYAFGSRQREREKQQ